MARNSKYGLRKCGKASRPPGVVPITNFFSKSPKSTNSSLPTKSPSPQATELPHPRESLPKPPSLNTGSCSHSVGVDDLSEPLTSDKHCKTAQMHSKVLPKKVKLNKVLIVLSRPSLAKKRESKGRLAKEGGSEEPCKTLSNTPQSRIVVSPDSAAEVKGCDVDLSAPSPKRQCLFDLTHSTTSLTGVSQTDTPNNVSSKEKEGVSDTHPVANSTSPSTKHVSTLPNCTASSSNYTVTDTGVQHNSTSSISDVDPTMDVDSQCSELRDKDASTLQQQPACSSENDAISKAEPFSTQHHLTTDLPLSASKGVLSPALGVIGVDCPTSEGAGHDTLTPTQANLSMASGTNMDCKNVAFHQASHSSTPNKVAQSERLPVVLDKHSQALDDLELVLCQKGVSYFHGEGRVVKLFNTTQDSVIDNLLDFNSRDSSQKLTSIVQYLTIATTTVTMPKAHTLVKLWELITDPIISSSAKNFPVLHDILCWLHQLLLLHPPGQCHTVDLQYAMFIDTLSQSGIGGMFGLWEHITELLSGTQCCISFFSLLVDLLLADYWAFLDSNRKTRPLFVRLFWSNSDQMHLSMSIRKILEIVTLLLLKYGGSQIESHKLSNLMLLVFLASTRCPDLTTELIMITQKLPLDKQFLLFSHLRPISLSKRIAENVPQLKESFSRFAVLFVPDSETFQQDKQQQTKSPNSTSVSPLSCVHLGSPPKQQAWIDAGREKRVHVQILQTISRPAAVTQHVSSHVKSVGSGQHSNCTNSNPPLTSGSAYHLTTSNSSSNLYNQRSLASHSSNCLGEGVDGKKGVPFVTSAKQNTRPKIRGKECTSVFQCENCIDKTCPRCIPIQ